MTPKEKAKQLTDKMVVDYSIDGWQSKQCALTAVNEIIPLVESYEEALGAAQRSDAVEYWQEVKQEIRKL